MLLSARLARAGGRADVLVGDPQRRAPRERPHRLAVRALDAPERGVPRLQHARALLAAVRVGVVLAQRAAAAPKLVRKRGRRVRRRQRVGLPDVHLRAARPVPAAVRVRVDELARGRVRLRQGGLRANQPNLWGRSGAVQQGGPGAGEGIRLAVGCTIFGGM